MRSLLFVVLQYFFFCTSSLYLFVLSWTPGVLSWTPGGGVLGTTAVEGVDKLWISLLVHATAGAGLLIASLVAATPAGIPWVVLVGLMLMQPSP